PVPTDARDQWDERRRRLRAAVATPDAAFVEETARMFPEASLEFLEQELLVGWANAELTGDRGVADRALAAVRRVAERVSHATQDQMPLDEADLIASARSESAQAPRARTLALAHLA